MDLVEDVNVEQSVLLESIELTVTDTGKDKINGIGSKYSVDLENGATMKNQTGRSNETGVKRARMTCFHHQPCVQILYNSLTRDSKRKLQELLNQWSEWHAQYVPPYNDSYKETLESGEETYFPAISVGMEKSSTVSFCVDSQARQTPIRESGESDSIPLYDRGYTTGLTSLDSSTADGSRVIETLDASRCFNCGSYNHALKECPKPRDNAVVNNARKQHNSNRNLPSGPRLPTRYYQSSPGGKFDGLKAGFLGAETRKCLGIGEFDPPPWLNRMREIGYPPGYLDASGRDEPSGITIFADEETKKDHEDGEILEAGGLPPPEKKMTVEFPGINAPIPENANLQLWEASPSSSTRHSQFRSNHSAEGRRGHYRDERRMRDNTDEGPPGVSPGLSYSTPTYGQRYGGFESNYPVESNFRGTNQAASPSFGRSLSDRGRRSPLVHEGSPAHGPHSPSPYSSSRLVHEGSPAHGPHSPSPYSSSSLSKYPPQNYGPPRF